MLGRRRGPSVPPTTNQSLALVPLNDERSVVMMFGLCVVIRMLVAHAADPGRIGGE